VTIQTVVEPVVNEEPKVVTPEITPEAATTIEAVNTGQSLPVTTELPSGHAEVNHEAPKVPVANQASTPPAPPKMTSRPIENLTSDEAALMAMTDRGFVIQISAANSLRSLESFVSEQRNRSTLKIYRSIRSGKNWYVVVEGFYADKDSALSGMKNLPSHQLKAGPWPKSISAVKLEIEAYKQQAR
jgi:DamX protein